MLEWFGPLLAQGGVLVDDADDGTEPHLLVYLEHAVHDGRTTSSGEPRVVSQRLQFILLRPDGSARDGGAAPYLDCRPATAEEREILRDDVKAPWLADGVEKRALGYAIASLVPAHLAEVRRRRWGEIDKVEREVRTRLTREISYWAPRAARLREEARARADQRINAGNAEATAGRMVDRLHRRQAELDRERQISALPPVLRGAALIVPRGLLDARRPAAPAPHPIGCSEDPFSRTVVESLAMEAVMAAERVAGHAPRDVSAQKKGWDIESRDGRTGALRFVEVKGRDAEGRSIIVTKNEILASLNAPQAFFLAIVQVEHGFARAPVYVQRFFTRELGFAETAVVLDVDDLLSLAKPSAA